MNQRDRITKALMYADMPELSETPQGLESGDIYGGPGAPPLAMPVMPRHPRNLLGNKPDPATQKWLNEMMMRAMGGGIPPAPSAPPPPGYAEGDNVPSRYPLNTGVEMNMRGDNVPLPPEVIPPDAPAWAREHQGTPQFREEPPMYGDVYDELTRGA